MVKYVKSGTWNGILKKLKTYRFPALILLLGLGLMLVPSGFSGSGLEEPVVEQQTGDFDLSVFTKEAETLLSELQGAGEVKILFSLENDGQREFLSDVSESQNGIAVKAPSRPCCPAEAAAKVRWC